MAICGREGTRHVVKHEIKPRPGIGPACLRRLTNASRSRTKLHGISRCSKLPMGTRKTWIWNMWPTGKNEKQSHEVGVRRSDDQEDESASHKKEKRAQKKTMQ